VDCVQDLAAVSVGGCAVDCDADRDAGRDAGRDGHLVDTGAVDRAAEHAHARSALDLTEHTG